MAPDDDAQNPPNAFDLLLREADLVEADETLYHYCGAEAFFNIIKNRSVWLSSLSLANDTMEGRLVAKRIMQHGHDQGLSAQRADALRNRLENLETIVEGLAFCVSSEGDRLSQWRGYADDGRGFAIGFSKRYLENLAANDETLHLTEVDYDPASQAQSAAAVYAELDTPLSAGALDPDPKKSLLFSNSMSAQEIKAHDEDKERLKNTLALRLLGLSSQLYTMKGAAFAEEKEWRLLRIVFPTLFPQWEGQRTDFRSAGGKIVPYVAHTLSPLEIEPIVEVVTGPKNPTPIPIIERFLSSFGFATKVVPSSATYR